jgi:hypothetical protein
MRCILRVRRRVVSAASVAGASPPPRNDRAVELVRLQVEHEALGEEAVAWTGYDATTLAELPRKAALRSMAGDHMAGGTAEYAWSL